MSRALSLILLLLGFGRLSANPEIDSLKRELARGGHDTVKINLLLQLTESEYDDEKWIVYNDQAGRIAKRLLKSNDPAILRFARNAMGDVLINKGYYANRKGNIKQALDYYHRSLAVFEELKNKEGVAYCLNNLGFVLKRQGEFEQAIAYYERSVKLKKELGDQKGLSNTYNNIGNIYLVLEQTDTALTYFNEALRTAQAVSHDGAIANSLNNIGLVYEKKRNYAKALEYFRKALEIRKAIEDQHGVGYSLINLGRISYLSNRNSEARALVSEAYSLAVRLNEPELILNSSELLSDIYESGADFRKAYHFHRIFKRMADSLFGMELKKGALELQFKYEWDKKSALLQAEKESALALEREKAARQKVITASIIGFLCVVLFFGAIFINRYKIINRQKTVIELQKTVLEKRNKDVTDSIMYAKRIQEALLKEQEYVTSHLPDHFVYFRPKDIVSGDFYWSHEKQLAADDGESRIWYLAAADCTGHGVPGAMMSMLGVSFLNEICTDEKAHSPAEILDNLRDRIVNELSSPTHDVKDGMDISLVKLDLRSGEAEWAGANNPLWIIRMDQGIPSFEELKGDKQPIGAHHQAKPFLAHKLRLNPGDTCYLFTDGYADQFGGDKGGAGKKFLYRRLKEMFLEMSHLPMQEQKKMLDKRFDEWRGRLEQVDDVCVIGFRY